MPKRYYHNVDGAPIKIGHRVRVKLHDFDDYDYFDDYEGRVVSMFLDKNCIWYDVDGSYSNEPVIHSHPAFKLTPLKDRPSMGLCLDCGVNTYKMDEYYMVHNELWDKHVKEDGMLCLGCLEVRLGRTLRGADFNSAPLNQDDYKSHRSFRYNSRLAANRSKPIIRYAVNQLIVSPIGR